MRLLKVTVLILHLFLLQLRRDRFKEELQGYEKQLEEFKTFSDVAEINKYQKKAQTLNGESQTGFLTCLTFYVIF